MLIDLHQLFARRPLKNRVIGTDFLTAEYRCPINVEKAQFWNDMHLIAFVLSGRKDWIVDGEIHPLEAGQGAFIRKGIYSTKQYFEVEHCVILFLLNDKFIRDFLNEYPHLLGGTQPALAHPLYFEINVDNAIQSVLAGVSNYLQQSQTIAKELVEIKFKELLLTLVLNPKNHALASYLQAVRQADHDFEYIMRKNFLHELSLEDFARLCGKSLSGFKRDFITHFGCPPGKWITEMRLKHAKSLLMTTDLTVNEICFDSGFKNPSHFSRAFRRQFEITPNQLRDRSN